METKIRVVEPIPRGARVIQFPDRRKSYPCPACGRKIRSRVYGTNPDGTVEHMSFKCPRCGDLEYVVKTGKWLWAGGERMFVEIVPGENADKKSVRRGE